MIISPESTPGLMELDRALWIVKAINQRALFAMGIAEKVDSLEGVSLSQMIAAKDRVEFENAMARPVDGKRTVHVVPADRLIAAAYALEHYDGDESAVAVIPGRDMFGAPCRKALGVVQLDGLRDAEGDSNETH
ncbi:hypothetical protein I6F11_04235 [Ensifer sp. NBAIM29]|nr:hypothetical protein [Ensifer sp. NBAIM29]